MYISYTITIHSSATVTISQMETKACFKIIAYNCACVSVKASAVQESIL